MDKRTRNLLAVLGFFALMNAWVYLRPGSSSVDLFFGGGGDLSDSISPRTERLIEELQQQPELGFQLAKPEHDPETLPERNPFLLGVDRSREAQMQAQMEEMRARAAEIAAAQPIEDTAPPEPPGPKFEGRLLGLVEDNSSGRIRAIVTLDGETLVLEPGQKVGTAFRVESIDYQKVVFTALEDGSSVEVALEENEGTNHGL